MRRRLIATCALAAALAANTTQPAGAGGAATPPRRTELPNGAVVVTRERPGSRVVALDLAVRAGARYETPETAGSARFLESALLLGTERWPTRDALLRAIGARGGELGASAGREIVEVRLAIGLDDLDLALDVLGDVLLRARFDPEVLEAERGVILQRLAERDDDAEARASDVLFDAVFAGHPLANRPTGREEAIAALDVATLQAYWRARLVGPNTLVGVVSGLPHEEIVRRLAPLLAAVPPGPATPPNARPVPPNGPDAVELVQGTDQAHVFVGIAVPGAAHPDRAPLQVLNAVVGRTSGRLYTEIRDRRGLAYSAYSSIAPYSDGGIFYAYAGTDPDTAEAVRDLLLAEVRRLRDEPISGVELENARNGEVGARILGRETSADEATVLTRDELYGLPSPEEQEARIRAVTAEDVQRVARAYLDPERMVVVVARPGDEQDDDDEAGDDEAGDEE